MSTRFTCGNKLFGRGEISPDEQFVGVSSSVLRAFGVSFVRAVHHPLNGYGCTWVPRGTHGVQSLRTLRIEVREPYEVLALEVVGAAFEVIDDLFGLAEVKRLLLELEREYPELVSEVFREGVLSHAESAEVLRRLVREGVSIRDLKLILEGVAEYHSLHGRPEDTSEFITELHLFLRTVLARSIVGSSLGPGGTLRTFVLSEEVENEFREARRSWEPGRAKPPLDPVLESALRKSARRMFAPVYERGALPIVVLVPGEIRTVVQDFLAMSELSSQSCRTIAYEELQGRWKPESVGVLGV